MADSITSQSSISVVVYTRNRAQLLKSCLNSLEKVDYNNYEIIVIDNAPKDDSTKQAVSLTPFQYVREDIAGLNWARNRGIAEATYNIIAFVDDDAQVVMITKYAALCY